jgi:hypothetical protein
MCVSEFKKTITPGWSSEDTRDLKFKFTEDKSPDLEKTDGIRYGQCSKNWSLDCTIFPFSVYLHMFVPHDFGGFIPQGTHSYAYSKINPVLAYGGLSVYSTFRLP